MVIYLPISFLSNWIWNFIRTNSFKKLLDANTMMASSMGLNTPLRINEMHDGFETEMRNCLIGDMYLSEQEEGWPLIDKSNEDEFDFLRHDCEQSSWRMAKSIFCLAVIWFTTEYLSNAALANTSVASTTVLTSTSGLFTLFFGAYLGQDSLSIAKIVAVFVSISGVAMTTIGKTWAIDEPQNISE
nr:TPA_asm: hypothetical protein HUJ06_003673 [Nelumbo nucifera]